MATAVVIIALPAFAVWDFSNAFRHNGMVMSSESKSLNNAKLLGLACNTYAIDHDGNFPPSLDALYPTYLKDRHFLISPYAPSEPIGYEYTPGLTETSPPNTIFIEDKFVPISKHKRIVACVDISSRALPCP